MIYPLLPLEEFENHPGDSGDRCEIRQCGHSLVVKLDVRDKHFGNSTSYQIYDPSYRKVPTEPSLERAELFLTGLIRKDGQYYEMPPNRPEPPGVRLWLGDDLGKEWKKVYGERLQKICESVYPDSKEGFLCDQQILILHPKKLTTYYLDKLDDLTPYLGWKVWHDCLGTGTLVNLPKAKERFAVRWRTKCGRCPRRVTFYTMSGCHTGAYCYVCDTAGNYQADLRNQFVVCGKC